MSVVVTEPLTVTVRSTKNEEEVFTKDDLTKRIDEAHTALGDAKEKAEQKEGKDKSKYEKRRDRIQDYLERLGDALNDLTLREAAVNHHVTLSSR